MAYLPDVTLHSTEDEVVIQVAQGDVRNMIVWFQNEFSDKVIKS